MTANYMKARVDLLEKMKLQSNDDILDKIEEMEEKYDICSIDKLWDGLHCLLTGTSATQAIENNLLSEAVIGTKMFIEDDNEAEFTAYIYPERLRQIVIELEKVSVTDLSKNFSIKEFNKKDIYPRIWDEENRESLFEELIEALNQIIEFYKSAVEDNCGIIVSIY